MWLVISFLASVLFTASAVIRGIESGAFYTTKGLLGVASFGHSVSWMIWTKIKRSIKNDPTPLPWSQPDRNEDGSPIPGTWRFRKTLLCIFIVRGFLEFCGSSFLLLTMKIALDNNMNQGISTAMMTLAGLMITLLSWCIYGEKLNIVHGMGMFLILGAIIVMGIFQKKTEWDNIGEVEESNTDKAMLQVVGVGVLAALSFSFEAITIKWLLGKGVDGPHGGYVALLFDGIFSLILLTTVTVMGEGIQTVPFIE